MSKITIHRLKKLLLGMKMMTRKEFEKYLQIVRHVHRYAETYDIHVHPFDTVNPASYFKNSSISGLFSMGTSVFKRTTIEKIREGIVNGSNEYCVGDNNLLFNYFVKQIYRHSGPYVFETIFDTAFLDKGIFLPVPLETQCFENQMEQLERMFSKNSRFFIAGGVPNCIKTEEVEKYLLMQVEKFSIVAIKIHPNLTRLDLAEYNNKCRLQHIIDMCSRHNLPIIIHGGRSKCVQGKASRFAELTNFEGVNFDAGIPIVISHGGTYDVPKSQIKGAVIPILKKLLYKYDNLYIDISGLEGDIINLLLRNIDIDRILFGSDSLYVHPLEMQIRLLAQLDEMAFSIEKSFEKVMSTNISKIFVQLMKN